MCWARPCSSSAAFLPLFTHLSGVWVANGSRAVLAKLRAGGGASTTTRTLQCFTARPSPAASSHCAGQCTPSSRPRRRMRGATRPSLGSWLSSSLPMCWRGCRWPCCRSTSLRSKADATTQRTTRCVAGGSSYTLPTSSRATRCTTSRVPTWTRAPLLYAAKPSSVGIWCGSGTRGRCSSSCPSSCSSRGTTGSTSRRGK